MTDSLGQFGARMAYSHVEKRGDRLAPLQKLIDWSRFRTLILRRSQKGRPPFEVVMMFKVLILQHMYGISDKEDRGRGQPTTRNEDGTWAVKNNKNYFGYKLHSKVDTENGIVTELAVTTAKVHDNQIDLAMPDEINYRDRGLLWRKDLCQRRCNNGSCCAWKENINQAETSQ